MPLFSSVTDNRVIKIKITTTANSATGTIKRKVYSDNRIVDTRARAVALWQCRS